jgi:hypothetical protein
MRGTVENSFEPVRDAFEAVLEPPGAAVAVWHDGRWVADRSTAVENALRGCLGLPPI